MSGSARRQHVFETAAGFAAIGWSDRGIASFVLPCSTRAAAERTLAKRWPGSEPGDPHPHVAEAIARVRRYFLGEPVEFGDTPLDLDVTDPFFARVYEALRQIGWGRTTTYGALAAAVGAPPEAARDVGQAMAKNPAPLLVPCHRVLAAGGKLGGFSAPGGATTKARMLRLEGVDVTPPEPAQRSLAL
jgi:methylated-DNA-[protein]-cysteine S-methyltransferase